MTEAQKLKRDEELVKLIDRVKRSPAKVTALKVEMEGRINRTNRCDEDCSLNLRSEAHVGCKQFSSVRVAHDYVLQYLVPFGLAEAVPEEAQPPQHSYKFRPVYPCRFSKIYTDSETEWTITIDLKESENVLLAPHLIDAFNHLAEANGKGIDVLGSGMHMAFLQGKNGVYPSDEHRSKVQQQRFANFQKSMTPLLPALYLLGANRTQDGIGITRSLGARMPQVSNSDKYSAIAYRMGAIEFRVFDTCYDNREQILDNVAVMARSMSKYWRKTYRSPGMEKYMTKPVYFGGNNDDCVNKLDSLFMLKEQVDLLNAGLKRIKPPYLSVRDIKASRLFKRNGRNCKKLDTVKYQTYYTQYLKSVKWEIETAIARDVYYNLDGMSRNTFDMTPQQLSALRKKIARKIRKSKTIHPIERIAYEQEFGPAIILGGN